VDFAKENLEVIACDLPEGGRRIGIGTFNRETTASVALAQLDFFGELAEIARTVPTFQRELSVFLMRALAPN